MHVYNLNKKFLVQKVFKEKRNTNDITTSITVESFLSTDGNEGNATISSDSYFTQWDSSNYTCRQALKSLKYLVYYDENRAITETKAIVAWTDVGNQTMVMKQDFEIQFISEDDDQESLMESTTGQQQNTTERNGNIGYHFSSPTLAGKKKGEVVEASATGLTVMEAGNCLDQNSSMVRIFHLQTISDFHVYLLLTRDDAFNAQI